MLRIRGGLPRPVTPIPHLCWSKFCPSSNDTSFLQRSPALPSHIHSPSPLPFPCSSHVSLYFVSTRSLPSQQSANTLRAAGPLPAFFSQTVCIHRRLAIFVELEESRSLFMATFLQRACRTTPWNVFKIPEAKNISPKPGH